MLKLTEVTNIEPPRVVWINPAHVCNVTAIDRTASSYTDKVTWNAVVMPSCGVPLCVLEEAAEVAAMVEAALKEVIA